MVHHITFTMNLVLSLVFIVSGASATVLVLPEDLIQVEEQNIGVYCSVGPGEARLSFQLFVNGTEFSQTGKNVNQSRTANGTFFEYGPLIRSENGLIFLCDAAQQRNSSILTVSWYDYFSLGSTMIVAKTGENQSIELNTSANPLPVFSVITFTPDNAALMSEQARYTISNNSIVLMNLREENSGNYTVEGRNFARVRIAQFSLIVVSGGGPKGLSAGAMAAMVVCSLVFMALGN